MAFEIFVEFRELVKRLVCENRRQGNKRNLVYIKAKYENFKIPFIYIYVHGFSLLRWCRAGFRGAPPLEEFEDEISGFGEVSIVCESLTQCLSKRVLRVQVEVDIARGGYQKSDHIEHDCVVNMGILALGQHCIRVVVYKEDGGQESRVVCP